MKRLALFAACMSVALIANAQEDQAPATTAGADAMLDTSDDKQPTGQRAQRHIADRRCLRATGSRIVTAERDGRKCANGPGRVYSRDDLDSTGAVDLANALRRLDPSIH